jgi:hypothetical protein
MRLVRILKRDIFDGIEPVSLASWDHSNILEQQRSARLVPDELAITIIVERADMLLIFAEKRVLLLVHGRIACSQISSAGAWVFTTGCDG